VLDVVALVRVGLVGLCLGPPLRAPVVRQEHEEGDEAGGMGMKLCC
jgi:hypothetical protein